MPKTVSASEAKNRFGSLLGWVHENQDEIIVESHGEPKAVIMSYVEYERIRSLQEQARRQEALARLERLRAEVRARNQDLTEAQALDLADQFTREAVDSLVKRGKIRFADDT